MKAKIPLYFELGYCRLFGGAKVFGMSGVFGNGKKWKRRSNSSAIKVFAAGFVTGGCGGARGAGRTFGCEFGGIGGTGL